MSALGKDIDVLATCTSTDEGISRVAWSGSLRQAYEWVESRMAELGMTSSRDAAGNLIGVWGDGPGKAVAVGSHLDSVPNGGNYDGTLGVLSGLEAIRIMQAEGVQPDRPLWLIAFMDEEGGRFGVPLFGSRAFTGEDMVPFGSLTDNDGVTVAEAMSEWDRDIARIGESRGIDGVACYVELHIEQGPIMESEEADIGVVTAIAGGRGLSIRMEGVAGHSGTIPMDRRRDALVGASQVIAGLPALAAENSGLMLTVGRIQAHPGALNVVPGACDFMVDVRSIDVDQLRQGAALVEELAGKVAADLDLGIDIAELHEVLPLALDPELQGRVEEAAEAEGLRHMALPSGAGHDALMMGRHVPAGMVFVPSRSGVSHHHQEFTDLRDCEQGARVLARVLAGLCQNQDKGSR